MKPRDQINKEVLNVVNGIKDGVAETLVKAVRSNTIHVEEQQLKRIVLLVQQAIEASYHKSNKSFMRSIDLIIPPGNEKKAP